MSNRHRKKSAPKAKPTIEQSIAKKIRELQALFTVPMRVTIVMRYPADPDAEIVFSDDQIDHVIAVMQRRRDAVVAAQACPKCGAPGGKHHECLPAAEQPVMP